MDYEEEQRNELEALSEIYYNEFKLISDKTPVSFSIKITPRAGFCEPSHADGEEDDDDDDYEDEDDDTDDDDQKNESNIALKDQPWAEFQFDLPEDYPDEKPSIKLLESNNLTEQEVSSMLDILNCEADISLGGVMIFNLVSAGVEWLSEREDAVEEEQVDLEEEQRIKDKQAEEARKIEGTPVTKQSFLAWKARFDAEMLKLRLEQQKKSGDQAAGTSTTKRLTGREMFETDQSLVESDLNFVEDLDQNQIEALLQNVEEFDLDEDDNEPELTDTDLEDQDSDLSYTDDEDDAD